MCESLAALAASPPVPPATGSSASSSSTPQSSAASAVSTATGLATLPPVPPPRASVRDAAGIIAFREMRDQEGRLLPHVCLSNYSFPHGSGRSETRFPKGGLGGGSLLEGAMREWFEVTGISTHRLKVIQGAYLDEASLPCRYLLARCREPSLGSSQPDEKVMKWQLPCEDPDLEDRDPIVQVQWMSLRDVFEGHSTLDLDSVELLKRATELVYGMELGSPLAAVQKAKRPRQRVEAQREDQREKQEEALRATAEEAGKQKVVQRKRVRVEEQSHRVAAEPRLSLIHI